MNNKFSTSKISPVMIAILSNLRVVRDERKPLKKIAMMPLVKIGVTASTSEENTIPVSAEGHVAAGVHSVYLAEETILGMDQEALAIMITMEAARFLMGIHTDLAISIRMKDSDRIIALYNEQLAYVCNTFGKTSVLYAFQKSNSFAAQLYSQHCIANPGTVPDEEKMADLESLVRFYAKVQQSIEGLVVIDSIHHQSNKVIAINIVNDLIQNFIRQTA